MAAGCCENLLSGFFTDCKGLHPGMGGGRGQELKAGREACPTDPRPPPAKRLSLKNPMIWYNY